jgi:hypothetical protein
MAKIGFIGLGIMGRPMAGHLVEGGHELFVHTRRAPPKELIDKGAVACANGKEVGEKAEVIITMVPDTSDVETVLFGAGGVAEGLSTGKIVVDMSSISPIATKDFAKKVNELGCEYLDAPVSGGEVGAKAASLTIMVGGPESAFEKVKPIFEGREPDHRRPDHRGRRRGARLRFQSRRRSGSRAPSAAGRLRRIPHPRGPWRTHDYAQFRAGLPHCASPEGFEPRPAGRALARRQPAEYGHVSGAVQRRLCRRRRGLGPFGDGSRA